LDRADERTAAAELVACANGLLHLPTERLYEHDPRLFNMVAVPFAFDPGAPVPERWLQFLDDLWPGDPDAIAALQQWFGYLVSGDTSLHKILLLVGPLRSGKGTIARVLTALVGRANVTGPTLASLGTNFGLQDLIGKSLAVVADARLGTGASVVVERLLSISGEDTLTVDRKYRNHWTGQLSTRFVIISNELPHFGDASGAIASRFVVLTLNKSWLGQDRSPTDCRAARGAARHPQLVNGRPEKSQGHRRIHRAAVVDRCDHDPTGPRIADLRIHPGSLRRRSEARGSRRRALSGLAIVVRGRGARSSRLRRDVR
jgi:P4 family phage/plasmid primase-like protien